MAMVRMKNLQPILEKELKKLQSKLKYGGDMTVVWLPFVVDTIELGGEKKELSGKVDGNVIKIYEKDEDKAIYTLRHEFIEDMVKTEFSQPYVELANAIMKSFDEISYKRQERVIDVLAKLVARVKQDNDNEGES